MSDQIKQYYIFKGKEEETNTQLSSLTTHEELILIKKVLHQIFTGDRQEAEYKILVVKSNKKFEIIKYAN